MAEPPSKRTSRFGDVTDCLPLDAKRKPLRESGIEGWYPYYAGFPETFARGVLQSFADSSGASGLARGKHTPKVEAKPRVLTVLDPWNGSGTTTRVAFSLGHRAIGFDINPIANLVASAKFAHPDEIFNMSLLASRMASVAGIEPDPMDPLLEWLAPSVVSQYRAIERRILQEPKSNGSSLDPLNGNVPCSTAFMLLALIRAARDVASVQQRSNPTWTTPAGGRRKRDRRLGERWAQRVEKMVADLSTAPHHGNSASKIGQISMADARTLPIADDHVDFVLTSPPYCTRIDYVVSSSFELAALGIGRESSDFHRLRLSTMGTPLARRGPTQDLPSDWPKSVRDLLAAIREHPSKASRSYYYKTFWQYFADAQKALGEIGRVLRPGGVALFVLQTSYYKELCVELPSLYVDLGKCLGLRARVLGEPARVRRALAQIHPHSVHHCRQSLYREAIVIMEKPA